MTSSDPTPNPPVDAQPAAPTPDTRPTAAVAAPVEGATPQEAAVPPPANAEAASPPVAAAGAEATSAEAAGAEATPATAAGAPAGAEASAAPATGKPEESRSVTLPPLPPQPVPPVPPAPQPHDLSRIAQDLQIRKAQVEAVVQLLDEENTVPFITRYRKERTGGLNEEVIRRIQDRVTQLRELATRKQTILRSIAGQGRLTEDLTQAILAAESPKRLEDLYLPFKPKKKSLATEAREKGLGPLAEAIWNRDPAVARLEEVLPGLVDPDKWLLNTDDVLAGVKHILADMVADTADVRGPLRAFTWDTGLIIANRIETLPEGKGKEFEPYFQFKELVKEIPPHRVLAINRGEKANVLRVRIETNVAMANEIAQYHLGIADHPHRDLLVGVIADALDRLLLPSLEREVRRELTERAQDHAVLVFARNLRSLLLQPPLRGKKVLAVDPGIRTGCKLAVLDETGKLLEDAVIYLHGQKKNLAEAKLKLEQLVRKHQVSVVAIGNGTGCRDAEQVVAELIADLEQRRLNPAPVVAPVAPVTSEAAAAPVPQAPAVPAVETAAPVIPAVLPPTESIVSAPPVPPTAATSITDVVTIATNPVAVESPAVVVPPGTDSANAPIVAPTEAAAPAPPPAPATPPISLEGLPEAPSDLAYVVVIEAGASDYSASPIAREEFPELDATTRGTISIGRRLQDPLAELVKIEPQHIGVGLYQHDVKQKHLKESLERVIESCVNTVGVDLNTASVPLLRHVSGLNQLVARELVSYRERHGQFTSRADLLKVPGLGEKRFIQAAGFLKIPDGAEPLDATWIHPESYELARKLLSELGFTPEDLRDKARHADMRARFNTINVGEMAARLGVAEPTLHDLLEALARPGRDPREDLPPPIFKKGVLKLEDIHPGMELKGTVLNVVPFGAFVDIGLKESGLVHISQMANRYIKSPYDVVSVGDVVTVWVIDVKAGEKKISLSMIPPGQERRPADRPRGDRGAAPAGDRPPLPPRADRPSGPPRPGPRPGPRRFADRGAPGGRGPAAEPRPPAAAKPAAEPTPTPPPQPATAAPPPPPPPPPPPRRPPAKPKPLPSLSAEKKSGKAALNTFAELAAFFKRDEPPPPPPPPPAPSGSPAAEQADATSRPEPTGEPAPPPPTSSEKPATDPPSA